MGVLAIIDVDDVNGGRVVAGSQLVAAVFTTGNGAIGKIVLGGTGVWHGPSAWRCVVVMVNVVRRVLV